MPPKNNDDDFSGDPLTAAENRKLRRIIRDQERMDWMWASARIWAGWAVAIGGAIFATKDYIVKVVKALFS